MNKNYKNLIVFVILLGFVFVLGIKANASVSSLLQEAGVGAKYQTDPQEADLISMIGKIIAVFLSLLGVLFMGLALYGGYLWMLARGNEEQVNKSKTLLRDAVIGLVIIVGAYAITYFVMATITKNYITNPGL